jgi:tetratricopeptide (TPR) repeat protein
MPKRKRSRGKNKHSRIPHTSPHGQESAGRKSHEHFRTTTLPLIILAFVAFLAYANAWPNTLAWDDEVFSLGNQLSGISITDMGHFFTDDVWAAAGASTDMYRPLLMVSVALDIQLFGDWMAGYHLVNILLHVLASILVFGLLHHLLRLSDCPTSASGFIALLAALVFAVHPIHAEVVNSVFNRSELLATLGVVGGLKWFLQTIEKSPIKAWSILSLIYLLVMFCRETAIVLPAITVVFLWIATPGNWHLRFRRCLPVLLLLIPLAVYLGLRAHALEVPVTSNVVGSHKEVVLNEKVAPIKKVVPTKEVIPTKKAAPKRQSMPILGLYYDPGRILPAVTVWFDAIKLTLWPHPLFAFHAPSGTNVWIALISQLALLGFACVKLVQKKPGLFLGLTFYYLSILPASRIVGELNVLPHLAERYLYMPSVGLAIALTFGLSWLVQKFSLKVAVVPVMAVLLILTPLTWARNAQWASTVSLAEADYRNGAQSGQTLDTLVIALFKKGEVARAGTICDRHADELKRRWYLAVNCGHAYASLKRYDKAEQTLSLAIHHKAGASAAHFFLAISYLEQNRRRDAREQFELAVATKKEIFKKEYLQAEMLMRLYPEVPEKLLEARSHLEKSLLLEPQYYAARQRMDEIDEILSSKNKRKN